MTSKRQQVLDKLKQTNIKYTSRTLYEELLRDGFTGTRGAVSADCLHFYKKDILKREKIGNEDIKYYYPRAQRSQPVQLVQPVQELRTTPKIEVNINLPREQSVVININRN